MTSSRVIFGDVVANINDYFDREDGPESKVVAGPHLSEDELAPLGYGLTTDDDFPPTFNRLFRSGDVLFHSRNVEKLAVPGFGGVTGEKIFVLRSRDDSRLSQTFLPWLMLAPRLRDYVSRSLGGSVNKFLNWTPLARYEFELPPMDEQLEVAELLWASEAANRKLRAMADRLDAFAKAHRRVFFSESVWPTARLGELADLQLGKMLSAAAKHGRNPRPYLGNIDVRWREFDLSNLRTMDFTDDELEKFRLRDGDILACEGRAVGRSAVWHGQIAECYYQKALHRIRVRDETVAPEFLVEYFAWCSETRAFTHLVGDSLIPHLTEVKLKTLMIPIPPADDQREFLEAVSVNVAAKIAVIGQIVNLKDVQRRILSTLAQK